MTVRYAWAAASLRRHRRIRFNCAGPVLLSNALNPLVYILKSDDQITTNATPIVNAIESYRIETGHYPDALEAVAPKHLAKIPKLNYLLVQPQVTYRVVDGIPYLITATPDTTWR